MNRKIRREINKIQMTFLLVLFGVIVWGIPVLASSMYYVDAVGRYESVDSFNNSGSSATKFAYGKQTLGGLYVNGEMKTSSINGVKAYEVNGPISIGYSYSGDYQTSVKEDWNLYDSDEKQIGDIKLSKKIEKGLVLIQKSTDGVNWETAIDSKYDFFSKYKTGNDSLYTITQEEILAGTYYRVYVAYSMKRKTGEEKAFIGKKDVYEYKNFVEEYKFFVCYNSNPIKTYDMSDRSREVTNNDSVENGFIVDKAGANVSVSVKRDNVLVSSVVNSLTSYTTPGIYTITAVSPVGSSFKRVITIKTGMSTSELNPTVYAVKDSENYSTSSVDSTMPTISTLKIGQKAGSNIYKSTKNSFAAYGITGDTVTFYLKLKDSSTYETNGWQIEKDTYGKKEKQLIEGAQTGQIDTGALIIQKSSNGVNWENVDLGKYANGLYTTDFTNNYAGLGDVFIYSPDGQDVLSGVYIRILYAYKTKEVSGKTKKRCVEEYKFYLCSNELDAVTFQNLSVTEETNEVCGEDDEIVAEMYKKSQTLTSDSVTVSGFKIDNSLNPTVTYTVKKNGAAISVPSNHQFTETGKYEIELKSAVGATKSVTIYVDRMTAGEALDYYFGEGFIQGKRIYSEGEYPVYEGGCAKYNISSVDINHLPVYGYIQNVTTGEKIEIASTRTAKTATITDAGEYVAVFYNNPTYETEVVSGDNRVITFRFMMIKNGTAPGPVINHENLVAANKENISGAYPVFYGLTYPSAASGYITKIYATREAAIQAAYDYEKGMVEIQSDGTYRYTGSFMVSKKEKYDSAWDLTDAEYYFAEQAVQVLYFDLSEEYTYLTLDDGTIAKYKDKNLRVLELERSVTIYANEEQEKALTSIEALPIINALPYSYLTDKNTKESVTGASDFQFIKDKYGCDSNSVIITDCNGKEYTVLYNRGVGAQLSAQDCPTGIVTITESTVYGDSTSYNAVYFANGDNTAQLTLEYYLKGNKGKTTYSQNTVGDILTVDLFSLSSLKDALDPYDVVIIDGPAGEFAYAEDNLENAVWADQGEYTITVVNRIGNKYEVKIIVDESEYATLSFSGDETEKLGTIIASFGDKNIELPVIEKDGYTFIGFEDIDGNLYQKVIDKVDFKGSKVLSPVWKANQHILTLMNADGTEISVTGVSFGAEYDLPKLEDRDGEIFAGWTDDNGEIYTEAIKITSDKDIVLTALYQNAEINEGRIENTSKNQKGFGSVIIIVVMLLVGAGGTFWFIRNKEKNNNIEQKEEVDEKDNNE